jgi:hypothetical protein
MTDFEKQLTRALTRQEPANDFTARMMAAAKGAKSRPVAWKRWLSHHRIRVPRLAPALMALLLVGSGAYFERHQRVERGEAAKRQLMTAMRIAGEKLYTTEQRVITAGE